MLSYGGTLAHIVPGRGNRSIRNGKNLGTVADDSHGQGDADPSDPLSHISHVSIIAHFSQKGRWRDRAS